MSSLLDFAERNAVKALETITDAEILSRCKTERDAVRLCMSMSPLGDKSVVAELEERLKKQIHKSHFSEAMAGARSLPVDWIPVIEDACQNLIPTRWRAASRGYRLEPTEDAKDREIRELREANQKKQEELDAIARFFGKAKVLG